jgi:PAS domain S-box-containing protein
MSSTDANRSRRRVLIVEDEQLVAVSLAELLRSLGYDVGDVVATAEEAVDRVRSQPPDIVLMDIVLRGRMDGIEAADRIRTELDLPVVFLTGHADRATLERAKAAQPYGYVVKPFDDREVHTAIEIALYKHTMDSALRQREAWLSAVLQSIGDAVIATDAQGRVELMNPVAEALTEWSAAEARGRPVTEVFRVVNEVTRVPAENPAETALSSGQVVGLANESVVLGRHGRETPVDDSAAPVRDRRGKVAGVVMVFRDIDHRRRSHRALAAERERLAVTLRSIGDGVIATDVAAKVVLLNPVAEELTGWKQEQAAGRPLGEVFHIINEQTRVVCENPVAKVLATGTIVGLANHTALIARDGVERAIADSGAPIRDDRGNILGAVLVFRDVTAQRRLEDELTRVQRIEALSTMAAGLAHDFNNMLLAILGNIGLARRALPADSSAQPFLADAEIACERTRGVTRQLSTFARGGAPLRQPLALRALVTNTAEFILREGKARPELRFPPDLWPVLADESQLCQALANLLINADDAMPGGGRVVLTAANLELGPEQRPPLAPGRYVRLEVKDEGVGIPPELLSRIFDPYFTTKQRGSGLGLASVHSIVHRHDGHIEVTSRVSQGTTFTLYLPAGTGPLAVTPAPIVEGPRGRRLLIMDDDEMARKAVAAMAGSLGYEIVEVPEGAQAVEVYRRNLLEGRRFDVVLLDIEVWGGMGGLATLQALKALDRSVVAVAASGHSDDRVMAEHAAHGFTAALAKPFRLDELARVLQEAMPPGPPARRPSSH